MATILIVDDVPANREVLATLLRHQGHRLLEAANGSEALTIVRGEHPDLVITDVLMPVMDGYELVKQLRLDPATRGARVVFHTAHYVDGDARALALSSGVSGILTKPAEASQVLKIVGRALEGESQTTPPMSLRSRWRSIAGTCGWSPTSSRTPPYLPRVRVCNRAQVSPARQPYSERV